MSWLSLFSNIVENCRLVETNFLKFNPRVESKTKNNYFSVNSMEVCYRNTDCLNGGRCRYGLQYNEGYCECQTPFSGWKCENDGEHNLFLSLSLLFTFSLSAQFFQVKYFLFSLCCSSKHFLKLDLNTCALEKNKMCQSYNT